MNEINESAAASREASRGADGRFGRSASSEATDVELASAGGQGPIGGTQSARLQEMVTHPSWRVRFDAASTGHLTRDQARQLADPDTQHPAVRQAAARQLYPGAAQLASRDPNPFVRMISRHGWDLPEGDRQRLSADPDIAALEELLGEAG